MSAAAAAKSKTQQIIDANPVAVFSKSYCPHCRATKQLLSEQGAKFYLMELDQVGMSLLLLLLHPLFLLLLAGRPQTES